MIEVHTAHIFYKMIPAPICTMTTDSIHTVYTQVPVKCLSSN